MGAEARALQSRAPRRDAPAAPCSSPGPPSTPPFPPPPAAAAAAEAAWREKTRDRRASSRKAMWGSAYAKLAHPLAVMQARACEPRASSAPARRAARSGMRRRNGATSCSTKVSTVSRRLVQGGRWCAYLRCGRVSKETYLYGKRGRLRWCAYHASGVGRGRSWCRSSHHRLFQQPLAPTLAMPAPSSARNAHHRTRNMMTRGGSRPGGKGERHVESGERNMARNPSSSVSQSASPAPQPPTSAQLPEKSRSDTCRHHSSAGRAGDVVSPSSWSSDKSTPVQDSTSSA